MKKFKKDYSINMQVVVSILLLVFIINFYNCSTTRTLPVTYDTEIKKGERDGAFIESIVAQVDKKLSNGDYIISYYLSGQITEEYWNRSLVLKKIRLIEDDHSCDTLLFDKCIRLIPVQGYFLGKAAACPFPFTIKNEYILMNDPEKPIKKVMFQSGNKEFLLELP